MISPRVDDRLKNLPIIKSFMRIRDRRLFERSRLGTYYWGIFSSFAAAKAAVPQGSLEGYDNTGAASLYRDLVGRLEVRDYPLLFWLGRIMNNDSRLLDFGGHFGVKYFSFKKYLARLSDQPWTIFDVPAVVKSGRRDAVARGETGLDFIDDTLGYRCDIFFASGSLQYVGNSVAEEIVKLGQEPEHILIGSLPVHDQGYFTLQNIGVTTSPYQIFGRQKLINDLSALGYRLVDTWKEIDKSCHIPQEPELSLRHYEGFYFQRGT